jgi:hypothetical protein
MVTESEDTTAWEVTNDENGSMAGTQSEVENKEEPVPEEEELPQAAEAESEPEWTAPTTYSVKDQERDIPEDFRGFLTDQEKAEKLIDLLTKADGLDEVKQGRDYYMEQYSQVNDQHSQTMDKLAELGYYIEKKNYHKLFEEAGVPQQDVINYVADLLREQEMTPQELQRIQQQRQADVDQWQNQQSTRQLQTQNEQLLRNNHRIETERVFSSPEVQEFERAFDKHAQRPGAFKEAYKAEGLSHYQLYGRDTTPTHAVQSVMQKYKPFLGGGSQTNQSDLLNARAELDQGKPQGVIPNIERKSSATPVKRKVRSLAELRKLAEKMAS